MADILVIDDETVLARSIVAFLERRGFSAAYAVDARDALTMASRERPRLVLLDVRLGRDNGLDLLTPILTVCPEAHVVVATGHGDIGIAVEAMKRGARDFLAKPIQLAAIAAIAAELMLQDSISLTDRHGLERIIGRSSAVVDLRARLRKLAAVADSAVMAGVLVTGQQGAGKALVARAFTELAWPRKELAVVDCSLGDTALQKALARHPEALLLRHIDGLSPEDQARLALTLSGDNTPVVVATTDGNIAAMERQGLFRADLLYRIQVGWIEVPSLAERASDILPLAEDFARQAAFRLGRPRPRLTAEARVRLLEHNWPGNVAELENCMSRAVLVAAGPAIGRDDIKLIGVADQGAAGLETLPRMEETALNRALRSTGGNISKAAGLLGISRDTLRYRMEKYGISRQ